MLELSAISCGYSDMIVVHELDLSVAAGTMVALVGANGAGKSTTLMAIAGHLPVREGTLRLDGEALNPLSPMQRVARGVAWVPEGRRLFPDLTVRENLVVGGYSRGRAAQRRNMDRVVDLFPRVGERMGQRAGLLSGGEQQMVAIGRALMAEPRLLLVDELSLGLMPKAVGQFYAALARLKAEGLAILLVEQNTGLAIQSADHLEVLESGRRVWHGSTTEAAQAGNLIDAYLGMANA